MRYKAIPKINDFSEVHTEELPYSYIEFMNHVSKLMKHKPWLRQGAAMVDIITRIDSVFAESILGHSIYDPYYDDKKISTFIIKCFESGILK